MKNLMLVRHAKASWEEPGIADADRKLVPKGIKRTKQVVEFLQQRGVSVGLMVSSPAVRAYETARLIAEGLQYPVSKIRIERKLYDSYYDRILDVIYATPNEVDSLMLFGHNPTFTQLANLFLHPGIDNLPTTGIVCVSFAVDKWELIPSVEPKQEFVVFPKMLS